MTLAVKEIRAVIPYGCYLFLGNDSVMCKETKGEAAKVYCRGQKRVYLSGLATR